jgi:hypothetical protein
MYGIIIELLISMVIIPVKKSLFVIEYFVGEKQIDNKN